MDTEFVELGTDQRKVTCELTEDECAVPPFYQVLGKFQECGGFGRLDLDALVDQGWVASGLTQFSEFGKRFDRVDDTGFELFGSTFAQVFIERALLY